MSDDRKNLKVDHDLFEDLAEEKGRYETWNNFFQRLLREARGKD